MKAQHQKAQLIAKLVALDPTRSYQDLRATILYLSDRKLAQ